MWRWQMQRYANCCASCAHLPGSSGPHKAHSTSLYSSVPTPARLHLRMIWTSLQRRLSLTWRCQGWTFQTSGKF